MGTGIAQVFAVAGYPVCIYDPNQKVRDSIKSRIQENLHLVGGNISALEHICVTHSLEEAACTANYITEAAPEKLDLKRDIFKKLVKMVPSDCILASNTSVIPITDIANGLENSDRIIGTHWWNPPFLIPLVEVIQTVHTSQTTLQTTLDLLTNIGKSPAHIKKDTPGFVANRLQHALWREAIAMIAEDICDAPTLDACVKNSFGMRLSVLGPLENADLVGLDLTLDIHKTMIPELDRHNKPHPLLIHKVAEGKLGFKTGEGFQQWSTTQINKRRTTLINHLLKFQRSSL